MAKKPKFLKNLVARLALAVLVVCSADVASALTSGPFTTTTPIATQLTDWSGTLAFPQFNPALGILQSVTLDFSSSLTSTLSVTNTSAISATTGSANMELDISVEDADSNFTNDDPQLDVLSQSFNFHLAPGQHTNSALLSGNQDSGPLSYTATAVLTEFSGNGSISLNASTASYVDVGFNGGNVNDSQVTDAGLTGTVTYIYQTNPVITWNNPAAITYGTALSSVQLNATSSASGGFAYSPTNSSVLNAGPNTLTAIFTPTDTNDCTSATNMVTLTVNPLPVILTGTRAYDATATAAFGILSVANVVGSDIVNVASGSAPLTATSVGLETITSFAGLVLGGLNAGNYTLTGASGSVTITNPFDPFLITTVTLDITRTNCEVCWPSVPGVVYNVLTNTGIAAPLSSWVSVGSTNAVATTTCFTLPGGIIGRSNVFVVIKQ